MAQARWLVVPIATVLFGLVACAPKQKASSTSAEGASGAEAEAGGDEHPHAQLDAEELQQQLRQALSDPDPAKRAEKLEGMLQRFPQGSPGYDFTARALIQTYAIAGELEKMEHIASTIDLEEDLKGAELLNAMAYAYAEAETQLNEARSHAIQALNILDAQERRGPSWRRTPPEQWVERIETARGYYLDTLAWIDVKLGRLPQAVATLREAVKRADLAAIRFHLGHALEQSGDTQAAAEEYAHAVALGGEDSDKAKEALAALDVESDALLKAAREAIAADKEATVLGEAVDEKLPEFTLADADGNKLTKERLADGTVTVLEFWASWCGPCKEEFPHLQKVYNQYRDNPKVRFVFITVDENIADAHEFLEAGDYDLPIAHAPDTDFARKFGVQGLPTLLIVGPNGKIRFRHVGFNPDVETELPTQIDALLEDRLDDGPRKAEAAQP